MKKNTVKIYIISLANQAERRKNISKQLTLLGLDYEFIDAIKFENTLGVTDSEVSLSSYGRLLNDGEVGCALSHRNVYNKINNEEIKYALILEDDALIEADILEFLDNVNYMANFDIVILGYSKVTKSKYKNICRYNPLGKIIYTIGKYRIGKVYKNSTCGTVGYLISLNGARKMLNLDTNGAILADDWNYFEKNGSLNIYHCRPFLIYEDFMNYESDIEKYRTTNNKIRFQENFAKHTVKLIRGNMYKLLMRVR